jgi:hypothetical protein
MKFLVSLNNKVVNSKYKKLIYICAVSLAVLLLILSLSTRVYVSEGKNYEDYRHVALYILKYDKLPLNYITKEMAIVGYDDDYYEALRAGYSIGGDVYENDLKKHPNSELLPLGYFYFEADIYANKRKNIQNENRGKCRIVFSYGDKVVYYTKDHYEHFSKKLTVGSIQGTSITFGVICGIYSVSLAILVIYIKNNPKKFLITSSSTV